MTKIVQLLKHMETNHGRNHPSRMYCAHFHHHLLKELYPAVLLRTQLADFWWTSRACLSCS